MAAKKSKKVLATTKDRFPKTMSKFLIEIVEAEEQFLERMGWKRVSKPECLVSRWSFQGYQDVPLPLAMTIEKGNHPLVFYGKLMGPLNP